MTEIQNIFEVGQGSTSKNEVSSTIFFGPAVYHIGLVALEVLKY